MTKQVSIIRWRILFLKNENVLMSPTTHREKKNWPETEHELLISVLSLSVVSQQMLLLIFISALKQKHIMHKTFCYLKLVYFFNKLTCNYLSMYKCLIHKIYTDTGFVQYLLSFSSLGCHCITFCIRNMIQKRYKYWLVKKKPIILNIRNK